MYHEFYWDWDAWKNDKGIRKLSLEARGLWFEMLGLMARVNNYGVLVSVRGERLKVADLALLVGADENRVKKCLDELEWNDIFSRTPEGTIYCRRMVRKDESKEAKLSIEDVMEYGQKIGATPFLCRKFYGYYDRRDWKNKHGAEIEWRVTLSDWKDRDNQPQMSSPINSCSSPPRATSPLYDATMALNNARNESDVVLQCALAFHSAEVVELALQAIDSVELSLRVAKLTMDNPYD